jgi:hypothetical protein
VHKELTEMGITEQEIKTVVGDDFTFPTATDERFGKYIKMKEMLPEGAVRQKMKMDGFTEAEIDGFLSGKMPATPKPTAAAAATATTAPTLVPDPRFDKYEKMKKMLPEGAVRQKMQLDGFTAQEMDDFFAGKIPMVPSSGSSAPAEAGAASSAEPIPDPRYEKFEKMKKMLPEGAVRQKMQLEGFTPQEIDAFMEGKPLPASTAAAPPAAAAATDPKFEKFEKMKKMLPEGAVRQKMAMEGITPAEIDKFFGTTTTSDGTKGALKSALVKTKSGKNVSFDKKDAAAAPVKPVVPAVPARQPKYNVKMKNIYWNKLNEKDIGNTLWKNLKQFELNAQIRKELEEWFAAKAAKELATVTNVAVAASKLSSHSLKSAKPTQVSLLDGKKTQNVLIALGQIKKTPEEISKMIMDLDPAILTLDITQSLLAIFPNLEEIAATKDYPHPENLDKASKFVFEIAKIPNCLQRLNTQEIIFTWFTNAKHILTQLHALSLACEEFKKSQPSIELVLSMILSIGNYVNDCTKFGDAVGIKLNSLLSLNTMKSNTDASANLLNFVALNLSKQSPELLKFTENYIALWGASELSFNQIINDIANVEKQVLKLSEDLQRIKDGKDKLGNTLGGSSSSTAAGTTSPPAEAKTPHSGHATPHSGHATPHSGHATPSATTDKEKKEHGNDNFYYNPLYRRLQTFLNESKPKLGEIKAQFKTVESSLETLMNQFGESHKTISEDDNSKQFFTTITTFLKQLMKANDDNIKKEQARVRKIKIEKERAEREAKRKEKKLSGISASNSGSNNELLLRLDSNIMSGMDEKTNEGPTLGSPFHRQAANHNAEPEENIFNNFFNRRSQTIEQTRNEFREKLQKR